MIKSYDKSVARIDPECPPSLELVRKAVTSLDDLRAHIAARTGRRATLTGKEARAAIAAGRR